MGIVSSLLSQSKNKMKFLLVVVLLAGAQAEAEPEADPWLLYGAVYHVPKVTVVETKPAEVKTAVVPYALGYHGLGYGYPYSGLTYTGLGYHGLGYLPYGLLPAATEEAPAVEADRKKREAEAEADPEADPWLYYSGLHHPLVYTAPVTKVEAAPVKTYAYSTVGYPYGYGLGYGHLGYAGLGYHGFPYLLPATAAKEEDAPAVEAERKKREAEPEADPAVLLSYSRQLSAPTPLYHAPTYTTYNTLPAVTHGVYAGFGYGGVGAYGYGYPYLAGK